MDNVQINLIRANLAAEEEDWEEVILAAGAVLNAKVDDDSRANAAILLADAYGEYQDRENQTQMLKAAYDYSDDNRILRKLGYTYLQLAGDSEDTLLLSHPPPSLLQLHHPGSKSYCPDFLPAHK